MVNKDYLQIFEGNPTMQDLLDHPKWNELITSEVFVYQLLNRTNFDDFASLPKEILNKPAIILSSLEKFYTNKENIPSPLAKDISFCMYCCNLDPKYINLFHDLVESNEELALWYMNEFKPIAIAGFLPEKYLKDISFATVLLKNNINNYSYLSPELRNNLDIYQSVSFSKRVKIYRYTEKVISSNWKVSKDIIINDPECYQYADDILKNDPQFYLDVLQKLKTANSAKLLLKSSNDLIKDNEHCVWQTVLVEPTSLTFASERLINSVSFAQQVISSMEASQISKSFEFWGEHVLNSGLILDELLPKIIEANCLSLVGSELKSNQGFILKALLLDSKQALKACSVSLLSRSDFIINAYHVIDEDNFHRDRYDEYSEQSKVFDHIPSKATEDADYIMNLYKEFKDIFISIIYPKISHNNNSLINYLNSCNHTDDGLVNVLEKMLLKDSLNTNLTNNNSSKKKIKI